MGSVATKTDFQEKVVPKIEEQLKKAKEEGTLHPTKKLASEIFDLVYEEIFKEYIETLANGTEVRSPIGRFRLFHTAPKEFYNMRTKKKEHTDGKIVIKFRMNPSLKTLLNGQPPEKA